ncbi:MAG: electron transfer flavoprotein subunit alpha/FixB family protein [Synergistales bacterium]|nr:electron transfer flavoprotein subunit alpha/FixB family protein [Synergistales bacterium]
MRRREGQQTCGVAVVGEVRRGRIHPVTFELAGKGRELADTLGAPLTVALVGPPLEGDGGEPLRYGADSVLLVEDEQLAAFDPRRTARILHHLFAAGPPEILLAPATTSGRSFMPALAALLDTGLTADCTGLSIEGETGLLLQTCPTIGGNVMATIKTPDHLPQMATVRPRTFRAPHPTEPAGDIERPELPEGLLGSPIADHGVEQLEAGETDIQDLECVVAGGKGLHAPEHFALLEQLAGEIGAGIGASRPTVESKWISYPHQVGLSGKVVSPRFYLAAGISGSVQHMAGMQTAETIVAVNKDPEAPIFRIADVGLCGDLFDILPRLTAAIRAKRGEDHDS